MAILKNVDKNNEHQLHNKYLQQHKKHQKT
jgi:hypothetical protein